MSDYQHDMKSDNVKELLAKFKRLYDPTPEEQLEDLLMGRPKKDPFGTTGYLKGVRPSGLVVDDLEKMRYGGVLQGELNGKL